MPTRIVESWDLLRLLQVVVVPLVIVWFKFYLDERQRTMDRRFAEMDRRFNELERYLQVKQSALENQIADIRNEVRDGRIEAREGRKQCSEETRAIAAQISEYPRRRELQEAIAEIWRTLRSRRGDE